MRVVDTYTFTPGAPGVGTIVIPEVLELEDFARINGGGIFISRPVSNRVQNPSSARLTYISQNYDSTDSMAFLCYATSLGNGADGAITMQWRELQ